jgi:hypothetical protein
MGGAHDTYRGKEMYIQGFCGPEGKRPLERLRHRWDDNIKMVFQELGWWDVYWIDMDQNRGRWWPFVNAVMNLQVPQDVGHC